MRAFSLNSLTIELIIKMYKFTHRWSPKCGHMEIFSGWYDRQKTNRDPSDIVCVPSFGTSCPYLCVSKLCWLTVTHQFGFIFVSSSTVFKCPECFFIKKLIFGNFYSDSSVYPICWENFPNNPVILLVGRRCNSFLALVK